MLLGSVVQVAGDPPPLGVLGLHQPASRALQLGFAGPQVGHQRALLGDQPLLINGHADEPGQHLEHRRRRSAPVVRMPPTIRPLC